MNYFDYVQSLDTERALRIYKTVYSLSSYAKTIYKGYWEDALDKAFFHVLENFDDSCGSELLHYATRVVNTISLGRFKHEISHDTSLNLEMDKKSATIMSSNPANILLEKEENVDYSNIKGCVQYLLPKFLIDFRFFRSMKSEDRRCSYTNMFKVFSPEVITASVKYLVENYADEVERLHLLKKGCRYRNFDGERYKQSMEDAIEYVGTLKGTIIYKVFNKRTMRYFYNVNIESVIKDLYILYYQDNCSLLKTTIEGKEIYCTLSGQLVIGREELFKSLENEIVGTILARMSVLRVVLYEKGKSIVFSSSREIFNTLPIEFVGETYNLDFKRITGKRVKGETRC